MWANTRETKSTRDKMSIETWPLLTSLKGGTRIKWWWQKPAKHPDEIQPPCATGWTDGVLARWSPQVDRVLSQLHEEQMNQFKPAHGCSSLPRRLSLCHSVDSESIWYEDATCSQSDSGWKTSCNCLPATQDPFLLFSQGFWLNLFKGVAAWWLLA